VRKFAIAAVSIAAVALFAAGANAQTMGEYGATVGMASGSGSMGTGFAPPSFGSDTGGSRTWGTSAQGGSWDERVGATGALDGGGDFSSRATAISGDSGGSQSRWPGGVLAGGGGPLDSSADRFSTGDRFSSGDRFAARDWGSADRFPAGSFHDRMGLDNSYDRGGMDNSYSHGGLDNSYNPANGK
jgi:hypothetical protein